MRIENTWRFQKETRGSWIRRQPISPETVLEVIRMRDQNKWTWEQIGDQLGVTRQNVSWLYKRWYQWAHDNRKIK